MRRIIKCKVRHGLQAALELKLPIVAILTDGLITMCSERAYGDWYNRYTELTMNRGKKWKRAEWEELGYELKYIHGPIGGLYPIKKEKESERSN